MSAPVNRLQVVGFCGLKGHGKDEAAKALTEGLGYQRVSFADGVKEVVATILHIDVALLHDPAHKEDMHEPSGKTYRQWMQEIGTEVGRAIWAPVWINWWKDEIRLKGYTKVVATDLRFHNELAAIREFGGVAFRVVRPSKMIGSVADLHESERYAFELDVDADIRNDGTLLDLRAKTAQYLMERRDV